MMSLQRWNWMSCRLFRIFLVFVSFIVFVSRAKVHYHVVKSESWLQYQQQSHSPWVDVDSMEHHSYDPSIHYAQLDVHLFGKHGKGGRIVMPISHEIVEVQNQLSFRQSEVEMNFLLEKITSMKTQIKQHKIIDMENAFLLEKVAQQTAKLKAVKLLHFVPSGSEATKYMQLKTSDLCLEASKANVQCPNFMPSISSTITIANMTTSSALTQIGEEDHTQATAALKVQIQTLQQSLTEAQQLQAQQTITITKLEPQVTTLQRQLEESEQEQLTVVSEERRLRLLLQDTIDSTNSSSQGHVKGNAEEYQVQPSRLIEELRTENEALKQRISAADAMIVRQKEDYTTVRQRLSDTEELIGEMNSENKREDMIQSFAQVKAEEALEAMKGKVRELTKILREQEQQLHQQHQQEQTMKGKMKDLTKKLKDQQQQLQQQQQLEKMQLQQQKEQQQQLSPPITVTATSSAALHEQALTGAGEGITGEGTSAIKGSHDLKEGLEFDWDLLHWWMHVCGSIAMVHLAIIVVINTVVYILSKVEVGEPDDMTVSTELLEQATNEKLALQHQLTSISNAREDAAIALHQAVKDKQMVQQQCTSVTKERDFLCKNNGVLQTRLASVEDQLKVEQEQHKSAAAAAMNEHTELVASHALLKQQSEELERVSKQENKKVAGQLVIVQHELQQMVAAHTDSRKENEEAYRQLAVVQSDLQLVVTARTDMEKLLADTQGQLTSLQTEKEQLLTEKKKWKVTKTTLGTERERLELVKVTLETQIEGLEGDLVATKNEAKDSLTKSEVLQKDYITMEATVERLRQQLTEGHARTEVLQIEQASFETTVTDLQQQLNAAKIEANDALTKSAVLQQEQATLESTVVDLQQLLNVAEKASREIAITTENNQASFAATIASSEATTMTLRQQLKQTEALAEASKQELTAVQTRLTSVEELLKAEQERVEVLQRDRVSLDATMEDLRRQLTEGHARTEVLQIEQASLETTVTDLQLQLNAAKIEVKQLTTSSSADLASSEATTMALLQQLEQTEALAEASKQDLTAVQTRLTSVEDQLKAEQKQSQSAAAAAMNEHTELVALQSQKLANVEDQLKESEAAAVVALAEKEQLLLRQGQLVQEADDLRLRCELTEQLLVQLQAARSTHKGLGSPNQGTSDHAIAHSAGVYDSSLTMGAPPSMSSNKTTMSESKSEPNLTQVVVNDNIDGSMDQPGSGSISLSVTPAVSPLRQPSIHSTSSSHLENGSGTDHGKETKDTGYSPARIPRNASNASLSQNSHTPNSHNATLELQQQLEPSIGDDEGDVSVGHSDKDHLKKLRRHQLALTQAALNIRVTELEGQIRKDQGRFQDMVNERKRVMALNESLERIVSRLREDSEADRHSKDAQCEQLTSELHRREEENANAQQVWMRRVAQLERTLTLEGEHIKTILRQRDQLAVRKAGLDARVESLDTQVRRGKESMRAYQQERLRLLEMYGESEARLHELLSLFEEMLLQGGGGSGGGGGGKSRAIGGNRATQVLTATGTKTLISSPSQSQSQVQSQSLDDNDDDDSDNEEDSVVDVRNDSQDIQHGRGTTTTSAPSSPTATSTSRPSIGGSSWVNRTVIATERRDAEARMSAVRALLGLDDKGQGLDGQGQGLGDAEDGTGRGGRGMAWFTQHDESNPTNDNTDKTDGHNKDNDNDHGNDNDKSKGSKGNRDGEVKRKGRGGVSQWMDATVQSKTNFMSCLIELEDRRAERQGPEFDSAGLDSASLGSRLGSGVELGLGEPPRKSSLHSPPRRSPALTSPRNRSRNVSVQAGTIALTSGLRVDHIPYPSNEHLDDLEHDRAEAGEGDGQKEYGYDVDMDSINASADVFDHSSIYLDHDHGTCTSPQMLSGSLFDEATEEGYLDDGMVRFASPSSIITAHLIATPSHTSNNNSIHHHQTNNSNNHNNNSNHSNAINNSSMTVASSSDKGSLSSSLSIPPPRPNPNRSASLSPVPSNTRRGNIFPSPGAHANGATKTKRHTITPNQQTK